MPLEHIQRSLSGLTFAWLGVVVAAGCVQAPGEWHRTIEQASSSFSLRIRGEEQRGSTARQLYIYLEGGGNNSNGTATCVAFRDVVARVNGVTYPASLRCTLAVLIFEADAPSLFDGSEEDVEVEFEDPTGIIRATFKNPALPPRLEWQTPLDGTVHPGDPITLHAFPTTGDLGRTALLVDATGERAVFADTIVNPGNDLYALTWPSGLSPGPITISTGLAFPMWRYPVTSCTGITACTIVHDYTDDVPVQRITVDGVLVP